jgi:hypothetical protein
MESNDNDNLLTFLTSCSKTANSFKLPQTFHKFQNKALTDDTFYELFVHSGSKNCIRRKFLTAILCLLEETKRTGNVDDDEVPIDKLCGLFNSTQSTDEASGNSGNPLNVLVNCEIILGCIVAYWQPNDSRMHEMAGKSLFLGMAIDIAEGNEEKFKENFEGNLQALERIFYDSISELLFVLLVVSVKFDRVRCIDCIVEHKDFKANDLNFPENMQRTKTTAYSAKQLLRNGYKPGTTQVIDNWITEPIFNDFLDSKMTRHDDLVEFDCDFLVQLSDDYDARYDDTNALEAIIDDVDMIGCIVHPVLKVYIGLKTQIHKSLHQWNFWTFLLVFMTPFVVLLKTQMFPGDSLIEFHAPKFASVVCPLSILFLIFRQVVLLQITRSIWIVWLEISLIVSSFMSLGLKYFGENFDDPNEELSFISVTSILTAVLAVSMAITIRPFTENPVHWKIMKKIIKTNLKWLVIGILITVVFDLLTVLKKPSDISAENISKYRNTTQLKTPGALVRIHRNETEAANAHNGLDKSSSIFKEINPKKNIEAEREKCFEDLKAKRLNETVCKPNPVDEIKNDTILEVRPLPNFDDDNFVQVPAEKLYGKKRKRRQAIENCPTIDEQQIRKECEEKHPIPIKTFFDEFIDVMNKFLTYELTILLYVVLMSCEVLFSVVKDLAEVAMQAEFYPGLKIKAEEFIKTKKKCQSICEDPR